MNPQAYLSQWLAERDVAYRHRVIEAYHFLCRRAARRFHRVGLDRADLEQVAAIGLIKAVDRYDARCATPFEGYAWVLIVGELMHHVRDGERMIRAPRRLHDLARRWANAERNLRTLLGREPSEGDVAGYINVGAREWGELRHFRANARPQSIDEMAAHGSQRDDDDIERLLDRLTLETGLARLSALERRIVRGVYVDRVPVGELARRFGYSRRHLTRIHRGAVARLSAVACLDPH